jgi:glyoxylase-like metal-dependent hydrolase (beta-lactamase superfamily II)
MLRVTRVLAPNPSPFTLEGTNTWVVGGDPSLVIDPGPNIPEHIVEVSREARPVGAVLVTHDHPDHAPGAASFAAAVGAPLLAFRLNGAKPIRDRQVLRVGTVEAMLLHTPGHTADHVAVWVEDARALFTGDTVLGRGTSFIDPPEGDLGSYLASLRKMLELEARTIYPGHGPIVLDAQAKLREYLAHRSDREDQIVAALGEGRRSVDELVESIYAEYPAEVRPLAARSVLAHLRKLENEGRVERSAAREPRFELVTPRLCLRCGRRPASARTKYCGPCVAVLLQSRESASE